MTTTTHFTALLAQDHQRRLLDASAARRLARTASIRPERSRRPRRPQLVLTPANSLQTRCI
jgi:hypothetical protein